MQNDSSDVGLVLIDGNDSEEGSVLMALMNTQTSEQLGAQEGGAGLPELSCARTSPRIRWLSSRGSTP
jgi:hypothetical protein